jgi:hypothetical protein
VAVIAREFAGLSGGRSGVMFTRCPMSGVGSELLNMFTIPDSTPDPDIKCSHDGTVRRTVPSCEHHISVTTPSQQT